jgi:hypothetical protein
MDLNICLTPNNLRKYNSPETLKGEGFSFLSDAWQMGLILLSLVTLKFFDTKKYMDYIEKY